MKPFVTIMFLSLLAATSCSRETQASRQLYTEADVRRFVQPGTPIAAIIQRFGQPMHDEKNPKGINTNIDEIVYFELPDSFSRPHENFVFCGFEVRLKDGKAVSWSAIHESTP